MSRGITVRQLWEWLAAGPVTDAVLDWAPDVAALTSVLLQRSQAFRFVVSPPGTGTWPPVGDQPFAERVGAAAEAWRRAMDAGTAEVPELVRTSWATLTERIETPLADVAEGRSWELCEAALVLHAIADEASAGCAGGGSANAQGHIYRARARELLCRTGSMARLPADRVSQLPKSRTTSVGITHRSLSRYGCTTTDGIKVVWDRVPMRRRDGGQMTRHANVLLLPWPLHISERDFVPVPGSVRRPAREPFGFFHYEPSEPVDLDLVDRLLDAALEEVDDVDVVVLPEGCLDEPGVEALESLLARRGVTMLVTGLRPQPCAPDRFPMNSLHTGVRLGERWWHYRQNKHHRWFLDAGQIEAYNIAGALHPKVRWWEAMEIPERCVHVLELGQGMTVAAVVCEDLARLDGVAELMRSAGPTLVVTLLLDGPQLASRWTARYAGVLADDPGSAVLTLTALGMATRSQPAGMPPSRVIAMWKDPSRGLREVSLDPGAQGVLLKMVIDTSSRYAADGRHPADDATDFYLAGVHQLTAEPSTTKPSTSKPSTSEPPTSKPRTTTSAPGGLTEASVTEPRTTELGTTELSVLSAWAQAVADAVPAGGAAVEAVLAEAGTGAGWRAASHLDRPSGGLAEALDTLVRLARSAVLESETISVPSVTAVLDRAQDGESDQDATARASLVAALEMTRHS